MRDRTSKLISDKLDSALAKAQDTVRNARKREEDELVKQTEHIVHAHINAQLAVFDSTKVESVERLVH